jgi:hypothetical protein
MGTRNESETRLEIYRRIPYNEPQGTSDKDLWTSLEGRRATVRDIRNTILQFSRIYSM